jgi:hypothetical protein
MIPRVEPEGMLFRKPVPILGSSPTTGIFGIMRMPLLIACSTNFAIVVSSGLRLLVMLREGGASSTHRGDYWIIRLRG